MRKESTIFIFILLYEYTVCLQAQLNGLPDDSNNSQNSLLLHLYDQLVAAVKISSVLDEIQRATRFSRWKVDLSSMKQFQFDRSSGKLQRWYNSRFSFIYNTDHNLDLTKLDRMMYCYEKNFIVLEIDRMQAGGEGPKRVRS